MCSLNDPDKITMWQIPLCLRTCRAFENLSLVLHNVLPIICFYRLSWIVISQPIFVQGHCLAGVDGEDGWRKHSGVPRQMCLNARLNKCEASDSHCIGADDSLFAYKVLSWELFKSIMKIKCILTRWKKLNEIIFKGTENDYFCCISLYYGNMLWNICTGNKAF